MSSLLDIANLDLGSSAPSSGPPKGYDPIAALLSESSAALKSLQSHQTINNQLTQVFIQNFQDRILILVTQLRSIGSFIQITPSPLSSSAPLSLPSSDDSLFPSLPPINPSSFHLTNLFGVAPTKHQGELYELYANQIGAIVGGEKSILLGIGLKIDKDEDDGEGGVTDEERKCFGEVMAMVARCKVW